MADDVFRKLVNLGPSLTIGELLPPARQFQWAISDTPAPLLYPTKPYRRVQHRVVVDANGDYFQYTVENGRITQWSNQFQVFLQKPGAIHWLELPHATRIRVVRKREARQLREFKHILRQNRYIHHIHGYRRAQPDEYFRRLV